MVADKMCRLTGAGSGRQRDLVCDIRFRAGMRHLSGYCSEQPRRYRASACGVREFGLRGKFHFWTRPDVGRFIWVLRIRSAGARCLRESRLVSGAAMKHPKEAERLRKIVEAFPKITVTVLGDLVADEFVYGEISRVSREAPVLILKHRERQVLPSGGANAVNNLAELGVNVLPVGLVGDDEPGRLLLKYFRHKRIAVSGVLKDKSYTTVTKTRILAGMTHTSRQQVVRVDREPEAAPNTHLTRELYLAARNYAHASDALLVSDYGNGAGTPAIVSTLRGKGKLGTLPIVLDSRYRMLDYVGITAATPNEPEVEEALRIRIGHDWNKVVGAGEQLMSRMQLQSLVITRGRD